MEKSFYFSHDYDTRSDEKITNLIYRHGWEGYGVYWALIEMLYQNNGKLLFEPDRISFTLRTEEKLVESIVQNFLLFKIKEKYFYSSSVQKRIQKRKKISDNRKKASQTRWGQRVVENANAMQMHNLNDANAQPQRCKSNAIERKGKERKRKERKVLSGGVRKDKPQSAEEVTQYASSIGFNLDGKYFIDKQNSTGWVTGKNHNPIKDWKAVVRTWMSFQKKPFNKTTCGEGLF